jgi:methylmalonyl-CoA mutase cobalamin-binding domain/chain
VKSLKKEEEMLEDTILENLNKAVLEGDETLAEQTAAEVIAAKMDIRKAIDEGLNRAMKELGRKFENFEVFLPELILAADAMKVALAVFRPKLMEMGIKGFLKGKVIVGTVSGDVHDIGKELVATALSVAGYEVFNLGKDVPPREFIKKAEEVGGNVIALSCLISPSMYFQKDVIKQLNTMGVREKYYVIVGGGPITPQWVKQIGADGYGKYAEDAVKVCDQLIQTNKSPGTFEPIIFGVRQYDEK